MMFICLLSCSIQDIIKLETMFFSPFLDERTAADKEAGTIMVKDNTSIITEIKRNIFLLFMFNIKDKPHHICVFIKNKYADSLLIKDNIDLKC